MEKWKQHDVKKKIGATLLMTAFAMSYVSSAEAATMEDLRHNKADHLQALKKVHKDISTDKKTGKKRRNDSLELAEALGLGTNDELKEVRRRIDRTGKIHTHYQQYFKGVPVWGSETVEHLTGEQPYELNGKITKGLSQEIKGTTPKITGAEAMAALKKKHEKAINPSDALIYSNEKSELTIFVDSNGTAHLAYYVSFFVDTKDGGQPSRPYFIVDAGTGETLKEWEGLTHQKVGTGPGGNAKTGQYEYGTNYGFLDIDVSADAQQCVMENQNVRTIDLNHTYSGDAAYTYPCYRNTKEAINGAFAPLNDAHYFGEIVFDLYQGWYNTAPLTFQLKMRVHYGDSYENAFWDGSSMTFGDGADRFYPLTSLDVVAHEVSHGFTEQNSGLIYEGQSGGINEAFSDMAGEAAEFYARNTNDFETGAEIFKGENEALRYMYDPPKDGRSIGNANDFWCDDSGGCLDVHYSSGVFNKAFYLLATTNGWDTHKAFDVFVHANQNYWTPTSTFEEAADSAAHSAMDLGYKTIDVISAFRQVGVNCTFNLATINLPANEYTEGAAPVQGTINLPSPASTDIVITLTSSDSGQATVSPQTIVIPTGTTSADFTLNIVDDTLLDGTQHTTLSMTATTEEFALEFIPLTLHDNEPAVLSVTLPQEVNEGDGLLAGQGVVSVSSPVDADVQVLVTSSNPALVAVPAWVTIPAGLQQATFDLTILNDNILNASAHQQISVTAEVQGWTASPGSILVNEDRHLSVTIPEQAFEWSGKLRGVGAVSLPGISSQDVTITLSSDDTKRVNVSSSIVIPAGITSKSFDILMSDDGLEEVNQSVTIRATAPEFIDSTDSILAIGEHPDLEVTSISGPALGDSTTIDIAATITTTATTNGFHIYYYLSDDDTITTTDLVIGSRWISYIDGVQTLSYTETLAMPKLNNAPGKTYRIGAIVDKFNQVPESNEANNATAGNIMTISGSDLEVTSVVWPVSGDTSYIPISGTIKNNGLSPVYGQLGYYLSEDDTITTDDIWLGYEWFPVADGGQSLNFTNSLHMPHNLDPTKTYRIGIIVDPSSMIPETDETNNVETSGIIAISGPDLEIVSISSGPVSGAPPTLVVSATIRNNGSSADYSELHYYISEDATITTADLKIGYSTLYWLHGGESETVTETLNMPSNFVPTKTYWIGAIADATNRVPEYNETNNTKVGNKIFSTVPGEFIARHYQEALRRSPDAGGWASYTNYFKTYGCNQASLKAVGRSFFLSSEHIGKNFSTNEKVTALYHAALNREPDPEGLTSYINFLTSGGSWTDAVDSAYNSSEFTSKVNSYCAAPGNSAQFVSQNVPTAMSKGAQYNISITLKNIGTSTWKRSTFHRLGSQSTQDNVLWGFNRVEIPSGVSVAPGQEYTFTFQAKAPMSPGLYDFQWKMLQENIEWFDAASDKITIQVN